MTPEELETLLEGKNIHQVLDVKTLILDLLKKKPPEDLEYKFREFLPELSEECIKGYFYMSRG
jgi:hypothetical protein